MVNRRNRKGQRGSAPLYLAVAVVSALSLSTLAIQMSVRSRTSAQLRKLNQTEGYYSSELVALSTYEKNRAAPVPKRGAVTLQGEVKTSIRRYRNDSLGMAVIDQTAAVSFCGSDSFQQPPQQVCFSVVKPPAIQLTANGVSPSVQIPKTTEALLRWTTQNARTCNLTASPPDLTSAALNETAGLSTGPLSVAHTYQLTCDGDGGTSTALVNVTVGPDPVVHIFANGANPAVPIIKCTPVTLSWSSVGTTACTVTPGGYTGLSSPGVTTPPVTEDTTYQAVCTGGNATDSVLVRVAEVNQLPGPAWPTFSILYEDNGGCDGGCNPCGKPGCGDYDDGSLYISAPFTLKRVGQRLFAPGNSAVKIRAERGSSVCSHEFTIQVREPCGRVIQSVVTAEAATVAMTVPKDHELYTALSRLRCPSGNFATWIPHDSIWARMSP